jgi:hypothetical protein
MVGRGVAWYKLGGSEAEGCTRGQGRVPRTRWGVVGNGLWEEGGGEAWLVGRGGAGVRGACVAATGRAPGLLEA